MMLSGWLLIVFASVANAKKELPLPLPPTMLEELRDVLLFSGNYKWMFWLCLFGYCMAVYRIVLDTKPTIRYAHGLVLGVVSATGGSTMAALLCGKPVPIVANEALIPALAATWSVMYLLPDQCLAMLKNTSVGSIFASLTYEMFRCHVMMNCAKMAAGTLAATMFSTPVVGPLVCGAIGGCGGGFMPFDKGLGPLEKDFNWRIGSAVMGSAWMQLNISYPMVSAEWARFAAVAFFALVPMVSSLSPGFFPLGANPLVGKKAAASDKKKK